MSVFCYIIMIVCYYHCMSVCCPYFIWALYCCMFIMLHFKLLQLCVSRLRGLVCFFLLRRGKERTNVVLWSSELGAFAKRVICLVHPSNMVGIDHPDCDAWELTFHLVLSAEIADTTSGKPSSGMDALSFLWVLFGSFFYGDTGRVSRHRHPFETLCYYSVNTNPRVTPAGSPATVTRILLLLCWYLYMQVLCC